MIDKNKIKVTMSLADYETKEKRLNTYKKRIDKLTDEKLTSGNKKKIKNRAKNKIKYKLVNKILGKLRV